MTTSAFSLAGQRLREQGLSVIPIMPEGKAPGAMTSGVWRPMSDWSKYCDRLPTMKFEMPMFEKWEGAGIGLALGSASAPNGMILVAADIDTDDPAISAAILSALPPSPVRKRGRIGHTGFYLANPSVVSRAYNIDKKRVLDLLAAGRQTILPPTLHATTGKPYVWITPDTLEDFDVRDLPVLPDDIAERLAAALEPHGLDAPIRHVAPTGSGPGNASLDGESIHRSLNEAALANLDAWIPALQLYGCRRVGEKYKAVAHWRESSSGRPTSQRAANLAISPEGIKDKGAEQGYTPLDLVMAACGADLDTAFRWLEEHVAPKPAIVLNLTKPKTIEPKAVEVVPTAEIEIVTPVESKAVAVVKSSTSTSPVIPAHLCQPAGLLGEIVEWMNASASTPLPSHNLGSALALLGGFMGRRFEGPTRLRTNFYCVNVAGSGFGKEHPFDCARVLTMAAGLQKYLSAEDVKSDSAIRKMLEKFPVSVLIMDEIGGYFRKILDRRAAAHDARSRDLMLTLFSRAKGDYMGSAGATEAAVMIRNPHLCVAGSSTPSDFWKAFSSASAEDGLLPRFLIFDAGDKRPARVKSTMDPAEPPRELIQRVRALMDVRPPGNLNGVGEQASRPIKATWGDGAEEWFGALAEERLVAGAKAGGMRSIVYSRVAEHVLKLALVYSVGCEPARPVITVASMEWAKAVVDHSTVALLQAIEGRVADSESQSEYLWALRTIQEAGKDGILEAKLLKAVHGKFDKRRFDSIIGQLVSAGEVWRDVRSTSGGGRPALRIGALAEQVDEAA